MQADPAKLRGLLWYAWHEFNAIRARSGAPISHDGMRLVSEEWWSEMTDAFAAAIGDESQTPWPSDEAENVRFSIAPKDQGDGYDQFWSAMDPAPRQDLKT